LPYGLSFSVNLKDVRDNFPDELRTLKLAETNIDLALKIGKPILKPLSSMSKKEAYDLLSLVVFDLTVDIEDMENLIIKRDLNEIIIKCTFKNSIYYDTLFSLYISGERILYTSTDNDGEEPLLTSYSMYEHLFSNHFDVFGLIRKGLAIAK